ALLSLSLALPSMARAEDPAAPRVVAILHPTNGTAAMDRSQLAQIYKGVRRAWNSQLRIAVYLPPTASPAMATLAKEIFKLPRPEDVATFYANAVQHKIFASVPEILASDAEVIERVAAEPGAIGVVDATEIPDTAEVKALVVQGL
ncbi:MAG: substrate-binding domain-containing protein, partial [Myxococcota bacterium]